MIKNKPKLTKSFRNFLLFAAVLLLPFLSSNAQIYPVQVMPVLVPPYSLNTSDYYNGTSERLAVVLTNTDLQKPVLNVRLRMYIEGQNAKLQSRDGVYYPTITLDAGIPQRLSLGDLAPYFNIDNLNFSGITRAMYAQNGKLPEGFYSFCFEVIEVNTGQVLSRKSCSMAYITLSDPPLLNLPLKGESIASRAVQNIIFQWTPRNLGSPNGAFNTEYEFTLKELWDTGIAPEAAFESTQPLYRVTVRPTTLLMGPAEPQLITGKRYAWRVRAVSTSPTGEQADSYRNNGFSEIYWFIYQSDCKPPLAINSSVSSGRVTINWTADPSNGAIPAGGYTLQYRERSLSGSKWYSVNTLENRAMLYDLKPGSTYEYRVGSSCVAGNIGIGIDQATYSEMLTLEINGNPKDTATINCGMISPEISITNRTPIQVLNQGDLIMAGGFPVKLTKVTGGGSFSGEGYVTIPMLGQVNVKVRFSGIQVNTERQLFGGVIETTYDKDEKQIADVDTIKKDLFVLGKAVGEIVNGIYNDIKTNIENDVIASRWMKEFEKAVDNPVNKISEEDKKAINEKIADGSLQAAAVKAVEQARADIASGKSDEVIKKSLVSNFTESAVSTNGQSKLAFETTTDFIKLTGNGIDIKYIIYFTPAGKMFALPATAEPSFITSTQLKIPVGALIGFLLDGIEYRARYSKNDEQWRFDGYYSGGEQIIHKESVLSQEAIVNLLSKTSNASNNNSVNATLAIGTVAIPQGEKVLIDILKNFKIQGGTSLTTLGRSTVVTVALAFVVELFVVTGTVEFGDGAIVADLPMPPLSLPINEGYVEKPPLSVPIAIPHAIPQVQGDCKVYVIWKVSPSGEATVAKYGMTCQDNFATKPECNPRPEYQVRKFNSENDGYTYNYSWIMSNVSKDVATLVEKSMIAVYISTNEGRLPTHHQRPCFVQGGSFEDEVNRAKKALEWIADQVVKYGK